MKYKTITIPTFLDEGKLYIGLDCILDNIDDVDSISLILDKDKIVNKFECTNEQIGIRVKANIDTEDIVTLKSKSVKPLLGKFRNILGKDSKNLKLSIRKFGVSKFIKKAEKSIRKDFRYNLSEGTYSFLLLSILHKCLKDNYTIELFNKGTIGAIGDLSRKQKRSKVKTRKSMILKEGQTKKKKPSTRVKKELMWDKRPVEDWTANQLAQYVRELYLKRYGVYSFELDFPDHLKGYGGQKRNKVWSKFKNDLMNVFRKRNEGIESVKDYVEWIFKNKSKEIKGVISINFIISPVVMNEYFATRKRIGKVTEVSKAWQ